MSRSKSLEEIYKPERSPWISRFLDSVGNEFFCEVDRDYIRNHFNRHGLKRKVSGIGRALDVILDRLDPREPLTKKEKKIVSSAKRLYGLIHARYILTTEGMAAMLEKYENHEFGLCQRVYCRGQPCLPVGESDIHNTSNVKIYCPKCEDIYEPDSKHQHIDGAYFGTTFPHFFLMSFEHLKPPKPEQSYVPRIHGFKVHKP